MTNGDKLPPIRKSGGFSPRSNHPPPTEPPPKPTDKRAKPTCLICGQPLGGTHRPDCRYGGMVLMAEAHGEPQEADCRCWNDGQYGRVHRENCPVHGKPKADAFEAATRKLAELEARVRTVERERDEARALLREALPFVHTGELRARIRAHLDGPRDFPDSASDTAAV